MSTSNASDSALLSRALELARRGIGFVEPNPAVGAVVANRDGQVVGEGWHRKFGGPHAEVEALNSAGEAARGGTLYVTLEPCCHFGKTPPCSRAVIAAGIRRVVVGTIDPAAHASGGGIRELEAAGITVEVGLLGEHAQQLIAPFTKLMTTGTPWFHAKWAMTLDGKLATRAGLSQWISNELSRGIVHELRGRMDGIVVGVGTVLADDPLLTARPAGARVATRIILDSRCRTPLNSQLLQTVAESPVLIVTTRSAPPDRCDSLRAAGAEILQIESTGGNGRPGIVELAGELGRRRMTNVLIEGGSEVLGSFFDEQLTDEIHVFIAPKLVGGRDAVSAVGGRGLDSVPQFAQLQRIEVQRLNDDLYVHGQRIRDT